MIIEYLHLQNITDRDDQLFWPASKPDHAPQLALGRLSNGGEPAAIDKFAVTVARVPVPVLRWLTRAPKLMHATYTLTAASYVFDRDGYPQHRNLCTVPTLTNVELSEAAIDPDRDQRGALNVPCKFTGIARSHNGPHTHVTQVPDFPILISDLRAAPADRPAPWTVPWTVP